MHTHGHACMHTCTHTHSTEHVFLLLHLSPLTNIPAHYRFIPCHYVRCFIPFCSLQNEIPYIGKFSLLKNIRGCQQQRKLNARIIFNDEIKAAPKLPYAKFHSCYIEARNEIAKMALLRWLQPINGLPDPRGSLLSSIPSQAIAAANREVEEAIRNASSGKRAPYGHYSPTVRAEIGKYACHRGVATNAPVSSILLHVCSMC